MCGIFGIAFLKGHRVKDPKIIKVILRKLFRESRIRGGDATGVAFSTDSDIAIIKHNIDAYKFIESGFYEKAEKLHIDGAFLDLRIILGHTRLKTKGTPTDRNNNHPIVSDRIVGVHNGCISNDDDLFEEYTTAFPNIFKRKGRVDTEIIFRLVNHYKHHVGLKMWDAISSTNKIIKGSYSCALVSATSPWMLWLFRNWSMTDVLHYRKYGLVIFASSKNFILEATRGFDIGEPTEIEYAKEACLAINTISDKISTFSFKKEASNIS